MTEKIIPEDVIIELDLSEVQDEDYIGEGPAIIHLTPDGEYIKGLHFVEDADFEYTDYIPEYYIGDEDMIMSGIIEDKTLYVTNLLK